MSESDWFKLGPKELGVSTYAKQDGDNLLIHTESDTQAALDFVTDVRNNGFSHMGKNEMRTMPAAHIPNWLIIKWMNEGFDFTLDPGEALRRVERDYPFLKYTNKRLA